MRFKYAYAALLLALSALQPSLARAGDVVATVDGTPIREADVAIRLEVAPALEPGSENREKARLEAVKQLAIEAAAEHAARNVLARGSELSLQLDQMRRQQILRFYDQASLSKLQITPTEIDAFISANPKYFSKRMTWHFHRVAIKPARPEAAAALRAHIAQLNAVSSVEPGDVGGLFAWTLDPNFDSTISDNWLGSEHVTPDDLSTLEKLANGPRRVAVQCQGEICNVIAYHAAYPDPVDPRFMRDVISSNLLEQKQAAAAVEVNDALLKRARIEFHNPTLAKLADKQWGRPQYLTADGLNKGLWAAQIILLCAALAWAAWILRTGGDLEATRQMRPKWSTKLSEKTYERLYGTTAQSVMACVVATVVAAGAGWTFFATAFADYTHDVPAVIGGSLIVVIAGGVLLRYAPTIRMLVARRRYPILLLLIGAALLQGLTLLAA